MVAIVREERGSILAGLAVLVLLFSIMAGLAEHERHRYWLEEAQDAADIAAAAAAGQAVGYLEATVQRWQIDTDCQVVPDPTDPTKTTVQCHTYRTWDYPVISGVQSDLELNWRSLAGCGGDWHCTTAPNVTRRWVEFPGTTEEVGLHYARLNWPGSQAALGTVTVTPVAAPLPEVTVEIRWSMPLMMIHGAVVSRNTTAHARPILAVPVFR